MERYVVKDGKRLRCGYTTGTCAAGAAKAAGQMLLSGEEVSALRLTTPSGVSVMLDICDISRSENAVRCAIRKDAGDDPDVTNGLLIYAKVEKRPSGFQITGGEGIGRVTRPGLACAPGGPAINPVPMDMIQKGLREVAEKFGYTGGFWVEISAPGGEALAKRTFNPRLGIEGGISILGTSGIVEPMSQQAIIDTIYTELDSHRAVDEELVLLCPGNYGRDFAQNTLGIDLESGVKCSNYVGSAIDYAAYKGFREILLIGHAGKLLKLAAGVFNTHSSIADCRHEILAAHAALHGADQFLIRRLLEIVTVDEGIYILQEAGILRETMGTIGEKISDHLAARLRRMGKADCRIAVLLFSNQYGELLRTEDAGELIQKIKGGP